MLQGIDLTKLWSKKNYKEPKGSLSVMLLKYACVQSHFSMNKQGIASSLNINTA